MWWRKKAKKPGSDVSDIALGKSQIENDTDSVKQEKTIPDIEPRYYSAFNKKLDKIIRNNERVINREAYELNARLTEINDSWLILANRVKEMEASFDTTAAAINSMTSMLNKRFSSDTLLESLLKKLFEAIDKK